MKAKLLLIVSAMLIAACSTPKYSYKFDYHDYNAGRKDKQAMKEVAANPGPVEIQPEMLVAETPVVALPTDRAADVAVLRSKSTPPLTVSKAERKAMIKELKSTVKQLAKSKNKVADFEKATTEMDHDLKLSLIFLIVSVLSWALYPVSPYLGYIVGTIAFILAVVFFIKWLVRQ